MIHHEKHVFTVIRQKKGRVKKDDLKVLITQIRGVTLIGET
jgi:hypothetical protein